MNILQRIQAIGHTPPPPPAPPRVAPIQIPAPQSAPASARVEEAQKRIADLGSEIVQLESEIMALAERQRAAAAAVHSLSDRAALGTLDDPGELAAAMREQYALQDDGGAQMRLDRLRAEREALENDLHGLKRKAAQEAYQQAVEEYAIACGPLVGLAQKVRDAAVHAGMQLTEHNSKHLIGTWVQIGGAVINLPKA